MPKPYADPAINTSVGLFQHANSLIDGWFSILFIIAVTVVIFLISKAKFYRMSDSLLLAFFLAFILSTFLWAAGLLAGKIMVLWLLFTIGAGIYAYLEG